MTRAKQNRHADEHPKRSSHSAQKGGSPHAGKALVLLLGACVLVLAVAGGIELSGVTGGTSPHIASDALEVPSVQAQQTSPAPPAGDAAAAEPDAPAPANDALATEPATPAESGFEIEGNAVRNEVVATCSSELLSTTIVAGGQIGGSTIADVEVLDDDAPGGTVVNIEFEGAASGQAPTTEQLVQQVNALDGAAAQKNLVYQLLETDDVAAQHVSRDYEGLGSGTGTSKDEYYYQLLPWGTATGTATLSGANVQAAWDLSRCDGSVTVAVIDTGCVVDHPDLVANIDTTHMVDIYNGTAPGTMSDQNGHGTHVAGIVAGTADNRIGVAGSSYNATVLPIKIFGAANTTSTSQMVKAFAYLDDLLHNGELHDLHVVNMSMGGYGKADEFDPSLHNYIAELATQHNVLTVCAGGNGDSYATPKTDTSYPSDFEECLSVTCLNKNGDDMAWSDYNTYKDISAPGEGIWSTYADASYTRLSGTSMAAPLVSGIAALMFAAVPNLTPQQAIAAIKATAHELPASGNHAQRVGHTGSAGAIDAAAALKQVIKGQGSVGDDGFLEDADVTVQFDAPGTLARQAAQDASDGYSVTYTGTAIEPQVRVEHNGRQLQPGTDYTVSYFDNIKPGTARVAVRGTGGYAGYVDREFSISPADDSKIDINDAAITVSDIAGVTYTGRAFTPRPTVWLHGQLLVQGVDYTLRHAHNVNAGQAQVHIEGIGFYEGTRSLKFTISPAAGYLAANRDSVTLVEDGQGCDVVVTTTRGLDFQATSGNTGIASVDVLGQRQDVGDYCRSIIRISPRHQGTTTVTLSAHSTNLTVNPVSIKVVVEPPPKAQEQRIEGPERIATAVEVSKTVYKDGAAGVIIATSKDFPDALAGAGLAGALDYPTLLTEPTSLSKATLDEIKRLGATKAIILGGTSAVSANVEREIADNPTTGKRVSIEKRLGGSDRYDTAIAIYDFGKSYHGRNLWQGSPIVATGAKFADALSISPYAAANRSPISLVQSAEGTRLRTRAGAAPCDDFKGQQAIIVGGPAAVPASVESDLHERMGVAPERLGGADCYGTSFKIIGFCLRTGMSSSIVACATGKDFPDALAAGPMQGKVKGLVVLVADGRLDALRALQGHRVSIVRFVGGDAAISPTLRDDVMQEIWN